MCAGDTAGCLGQVRSPFQTVSSSQHAEHNAVTGSVLIIAEPAGETGAEVVRLLAERWQSGTAVEGVKIVPISALEALIDVVLVVNEAESNCPDAYGAGQAESADTGETVPLWIDSGAVLWNSNALTVGVEIVPIDTFKAHPSCLIKPGAVWSDNGAYTIHRPVTNHTPETLSPGVGIETELGQSTAPALEVEVPLRGQTFSTEPIDIVVGEAVLDLDEAATLESNVTCVTLLAVGLVARSETVGQHDTLDANLAFKSETVKAAEAHEG